MAKYTADDACMAQARAASGGRLTDEEIREAFQRIADERDRLAAKGQGDGMAEKLSAFQQREAERAKVAAAMAKRHAELNAVANDKLLERMDAYVKGGLSEKQGMLALIEGSQGNVAGARNSAYATAQAYEAKYLGGLHAELNKAIPGFNRVASDRRFNDAIMREMAELKEGGLPGVTKDADALKAAKIYAKHAEIARQDLNKLGASIGKLDGWAGSQVHDDIKIVLAGRDAWKASILPRLDLERTFEGVTDRAALDKALDGVFDNIVTGVRSGAMPPESGRVNPANLAKSLGRERVLHFKSADDAIAYRDEFGHGLLTSAMAHHFRKSAQKAAAMEVFGPNPENMVARLVKQRQDKLKASDSAGNRKAIDELDSGSIQGAVDIMVGAANIPGSVRAADISSKIRLWQSAAKLGGALLSSTTDPVVVAVASQFRGSGFVNGFVKQIGGILQGRPKGEQKEIGYLLGDHFEGISAEIANATYANDGVTGMWAKGSDLFFRMTGLTWWTDVNRSAARRTIAAEAAMRAGTAFDALPANYRHVLGLHDIRAAEWDVIRKGTFTAENGNSYITPDRIEDEKVAMAFRRFVADEVNYAMIETDAASRRYATWNATRPGTFAGETARFAMQFKGFPIAFSNRVLGRAIRGQRADASMVERGVHIGSLIAGMTVAGYAAMTMKDVVKGYWPPRDPTSLKTILAAMQQGGGIGLYGDFIFGEVNRFGGNTLETLAGPTIGSVAGLVDTLQKGRDAVTGEKRLKGSEVLNQAVGSTPFANLFYVKPAVDYLFLDSLRESLSPGAAARKAALRRKDYGQEKIRASDLGF